MSSAERATPVAASVHGDKVWVTLDAQRVIGLPLSAFPWLQQATPEQQQNVQISPISLYWADLEDGIDLDYFTGVWKLTDQA